MMTTNYAKLWQRLRPQVEHAWRELPAEEAAWLRGRLHRIADLQRQLHQLFLAADGLDVCLRCAGACCGSGTHHLTLANLLALIDGGEGVPSPDFSRSCPWLGENGCRLSPGKRPFNCVTFVCEQIEQRLSQEQLAAFYRLEKELREEYLQIARRYVGGSLQGILLATLRAGERSLLAPIPSRP